MLRASTPPTEGLSDAAEPPTTRAVAEAETALYHALGGQALTQHSALPALERLEVLAGGATGPYLRDPFTPAKLTTDHPHVGKQVDPPSGVAAPWRRVLSTQPVADLSRDRTVSAAVWDAVTGLLA